VVYQNHGYVLQHPSPLPNSTLVYMIIYNPNTPAATPIATTPIPAILLTPAFVVAEAGALPVADLVRLIDAVPFTAEVGFEAPEVADGTAVGTLLMVTPAFAQRDWTAGARPL
jgi:hypothetical protein